MLTNTSNITVFPSLDWSLIFSVIGAVSGVIAAAIAILIGLRSKTVYRPDLMFNMGLLYANLDIRKVLKKTTISTLIYGASISQNSEVIFICPYIIINRGKLPISNITLTLQYASKHAVNSDDKIIGSIDRDNEIEYGILSFNPKWDEFHNIQILDSMAQVRHSIPLLRPGEEYVIPDFMKFVKGSSYNKIDNENIEYGISKELAKKLHKINKLCGFSVIDATLFSENCPPITKRLKLLWFDSDSEEELMMLLNNARKAFWGGKWLSPGRYFTGTWPFKVDLMIEEYGEEIFPKLNMIKASKNRFFYIEREDLWASRRNIVTIGMPPWNYLELHVDPDIMLEPLRYKGFAYGQIHWVKIKGDAMKEKLLKMLKRRRVS